MSSDGIGMITLSIATQIATPRYPTASYMSVTSWRTGPFRKSNTAGRIGGEGRAYPPSVTVERSADPVVLTGADLTVEQVEAVARHGAVATLDAAARSRMERSRAVVDSLVADGEVVYGVTTGVGAMADRLIDPADAERLQENLLV